MNYSDLIKFIKKKYYIDSSRFDLLKFKSKEDESISKTKHNNSNEQSESVSNIDQIDIKPYLNPVLISQNSNSKWEEDDEFSYSKDYESIDEKDKELIKQYEHRFRKTGDVSFQPFIHQPTLK